jgi:hypothetical protein
MTLVNEAIFGTVEVFKKNMAPGVCPEPLPLLWKPSTPLGNQGYDSAIFTWLYRECPSCSRFISMFFASSSAKRSINPG